MGSYMSSHRYHVILEYITRWLIKLEGSHGSKRTASFFYTFLYLCLNELELQCSISCPSISSKEGKV